MTRSLVMVACLALSACAIHRSPQPFTIHDLTFATGLPGECDLSSAPSRRLDGNRFQSGLWGGLPITTNPWSGTDAKIIASIRERMYGPPRMPDGPPLDRRAAARFFL